MKMSELRALDADGLKKRLVELRKEQFSFRLQKATGQLSQTHHMKTIRRDIARVKTVLSSLRSEG